MIRGNKNRLKIGSKSMKKCYPRWKASILLENQAQQAPGTHREASGGPKRRLKALQETPGMPPRRGQDASQEAPGRARDAPKRLQEAPGHHQDASIGSKSCPDLLRSSILGDFWSIFDSFFPPKPTLLTGTHGAGTRLCRAEDN